MDSAISARGAQIITWSCVTFSIAAFFVSLRLLVRWKVVSVIGKEDGCICLALIAALIACLSINFEVSKGGEGQHWDTLTPAQTNYFLKFSYLSILFYNLSLCLTKFAILLLCLRVFAPSNWRKACLAILVLVTLYTIWVITTSIMPCVPIPRYWDQSVHGWCFSHAVVWFVNAGLNIATDFAVVLLPIIGISRLQLPRKKKIGVNLVFALGFFISVISILRLRAIHISATTADPTYDTGNIAIWSVVEINGAIVGACLPTLQPLITRLWPRLLSSNHSHPTHTCTANWYRMGRGRRETKMLDIPELKPEPSSATEILAEEGAAGVRLGDTGMEGDRDGKDVRAHTENIENDGMVSSDMDTIMGTARRTSSAGWSGRSSQRPVYENRRSS